MRTGSLECGCPCLPPCASPWVAYVPLGHGYPACLVGSAEGLSGRTPQAVASLRSYERLASAMSFHLLPPPPWISDQVGAARSARQDARRDVCSSPSIHADRVTLRSCQAPAYHGDPE